MSKPVILLSIPALREKDVAVMRNLRSLTAGGEIAELTPSFPCVTCPVQANMTTGCGPSEHGVVANGFFWRERRQVEMWTAPNDCVERPQIWDLLSHHGRGLSSAVWFPMHSKGCEADYVCTPAPIHNPDGSESLWCYTRPTEFYGTLRDSLGHFPLMNYWGPLANVNASEPVTTVVVQRGLHVADGVATVRTARHRDGDGALRHDPVEAVEVECVGSDDGSSGVDFAVGKLALSTGVCLSVRKLATAVVAAASLGIGHSGPPNQMLPRDFGAEGLRRSDSAR
jgi:hypothetical protein